ncbi:receptor kinase 3 [Prunus dulcis]|uniref:Receptor kinase 3 n=1 Tax=Prunus dulcis TaxID=3755 RepID=A0A4Y1RBG6_PRUDU|nr:receptor kinase 3 [Prunus dulcis]
MIVAQRMTHRSSVNYDIQTDDQQYGFKIFCQASGGACHQYRPFHTVFIPLGFSWQGFNEAYSISVCGLQGGVL